MESLEIKSSSSSKGSMEVDMVFPTKPASSSLGKPVTLYSNFYKFNCTTGGRDVLFEYQVKTAPQLTCHSNEEKIKMSKIVRKMKDKLEAEFENHVYWEGFIYSFENKESDFLDSVQIEEDGVEYMVNVELHDNLSFDSPKVARFFRAFMNQLIRKAKLRLARGGKHFDPYKPMDLDGVNMYRAYFNTMKCIDGAIYLNLNPSVKFFQKDPIINDIYNLRSESRVKEALTGRSVMTLYNCRVYKIDEIDFTKNPTHKFF